MALVWADGFDHWGTNAHLGEFYSFSDNYGLTGDNPRTGDNCFLINAYGHLTKPLPSATGYVCGTALNFLAYTGNQAYAPYFGFDNGCGFTVNNDGSVTLYDNVGQIWQSAAGIIALGSYSYMELWADILTGKVILRLNNKELVEADGRLVGSANITNYVIHGGNQNFTQANVRLDDFYVNDFSGGNNNGFDGDIRCRTSFTDSAGANQAWVANGLPDGFNCLRQVPINPDDYISGQNVGDISSFGIDPIPTNSAAVFGIMVFANLNKTDAGLCEITPGVDSNGSVGNIDAVTPGTGAAYYAGPIQLDPDGDKQWQYPAINSLLGRLERTG